MRENHSARLWATARLVALIATAATVTGFGQPLLYAEPAPVLGKCCGGTSDECCGCIAVAGFVETGRTDPTSICIAAPAGYFVCEEESYYCILGLVQTYSLRLGTGCTSVCRSPSEMKNITMERDRCLTTYGGCD